MRLLLACLFVAAACTIEARALNARVNIIMVYADSIALLSLVRDVSLFLLVWNTWASYTRTASVVDSQWHATEKETGPADCAAPEESGTPWMEEAVVEQVENE